MKKYTLCLTQNCNLRCNYCYIEKRNVRMSISIAEKIIDFAFKNTPSDKKIDIGFFGGEPLLEFELIKVVTEMIERHPSYDQERLELSITTNGTIFSAEIAEFLKMHRIVLCLSCDGPHNVQDKFRRFSSGMGSSEVVENTIRQALATLPMVLVNAVYHPATFRYLSEVIDYLSSLGLRQIYLNPDFSAPWSKADVDRLPEVYSRVGELYMDYYLQQNPHFISLIDSKIAVILRGGYQPLDRCQMGKREFAFTPEGNIYLCERLIGSGNNTNKHCIGNINDGLKNEWLSCNNHTSQSHNEECLSCGLIDYCMNWCGCSNYLSSGYYNRVSPFLCASEKAAIQVAFKVFQNLQGKLGPVFMDHLDGMSFLNSRLKI